MNNCFQGQRSGCRAARRSRRAAGGGRPRRTERSGRRYHQVADGLGAAQILGGVGDDQRLAAERTQDAQRKRHLLHRVALVEVEAPAQHRDRLACQPAARPLATVASES